MITIIVAGILGILLGTVLDIRITSQMSIYISVIFLSSVLSLLGGGIAILKERYDERKLVAGFITNVAISVIFVYLGAILNIPLYLASIVFLGGKIYVCANEIINVLVLREKSNDEK